MSWRRVDRYSCPVLAVHLHFHIREGHHTPAVDTLIAVRIDVDHASVQSLSIVSILSLLRLRRTMKRSAAMRGRVCIESFPPTR
jgi:hypothetical protein